MLRNNFENYEDAETIGFWHVAGVVLQVVALVCLIVIIVKFWLVSVVVGITLALSGHRTTAKSVSSLPHLGYPPIDF